ncbi:DeoR/GlpR family DNA-binding transcription regulator [Enterococcus faecalis]
MLKEERLNAIVALVDQRGAVKVSEIMERLAVSDMTVRRDLTELEEAGRLKRVHGGASSLTIYRHGELSHDDKQIINSVEKKEIVQKALKLINEEDTIFLGPGTTIELLAEGMEFKNLRVVTNCLPVFETLSKKRNEITVYLIGGEMRTLTKAFFGEIANKALAEMHFHKAFFSCNALKDNKIMTATIEEGQTQAIALNNSIERYLLMDTSKVEKQDFYSFYQLHEVTAIVTNQDEFDTYKTLEKEVKVIR